MKNLYALNENKKLIHIGEVDKEKKEKYFCCNCNDQLIARKGKIKAHHFAHKQQLNCNYETYLHKVAKIKFYDKYQKCLKNKEPFWIEYFLEKSCNTCLNLKPINKTCSLDNETKLFDLTKSFDNIYIEKKHDNFIADILIKSSKSKEVIFIEFAVTHLCEEEKRNSNIRIVEIKLTTEKDLDFIDENKIAIGKFNTNFFNFKEVKTIDSFYNKNNCIQLFDIFIINSNGKVKLIKNLSLNKVIKEYNRKLLYIKFIHDVEYFDGYTFIDLVQTAALDGIKTKNCYACRFSTINNNYNRKYNLFCKRLRTEIENSNYGVNCNKFWKIDEKMFEEEEENHF